MQVRRLALVGALWGVVFLFQPGPQSGLPWWKGNTHTHSLWSDGDHYPEMVALWYREHGYDFLVMTDHNPPPVPEERWVVVASEGASREAYRAYRARFGGAWVEERRAGDTLRVRLKRLDEFRARVERPGRFVLLPGQEITQYLGGRAAHMNALNLAEPVAPSDGATLREIFERNIAAVDSARGAAASAVALHLNHPNWLWSVTAEDLAVLDGLRLFERYNAHPAVNNEGDSTHPGVGALWDVALARRLARGAAPLYGVATDDAHDYHRFGSGRRNPGRAWVMVRAAALTPGALMEALERGQFYASTGVVLDDVRLERRRIALRIRAEPRVTYTTRFIGTRAGARPEIGEVLAEVQGAQPSYELRGDELYVRAEIVSSKLKENPPTPGEYETAWVQPFVFPGAGTPHSAPP